MAGMMDYSGLGGMMGSGWSGMWGIGLTAAILVLVNILAVLWALVDVMKPKRLDSGVRVSWVVIILALQLLGVLLYVLTGRKQAE